MIFHIVSVQVRIFRGATVDGEFLTALPEEVLKGKDFQKVPVLTGVTNHEFGWLLPFVRNFCDIYFIPMLLTCKILLVRVFQMSKISISQTGFCSRWMGDRYGQSNSDERICHSSSPYHGESHTH